MNLEEEYIYEVFCFFINQANLFWFLTFEKEKRVILEEYANNNPQEKYNSIYFNINLNNFINTIKTEEPSKNILIIKKKNK